MRRTQCRPPRCAMLPTPLHATLRCSTLPRPAKLHHASHHSTFHVALPCSAPPHAASFHPSRHRSAPHSSALDCLAPPIQMRLPAFRCSAGVGVMEVAFRGTQGDFPRRGVSRITRLAAKRGMRAGWNFDYQHEDPLYRETV